MANYEITAIGTEERVHDLHEHITMVELDDNPNLRFSRSTIINELGDPAGDRYYTYAGGERTVVVLRDCPTCSERDYITTLPDTTAKNNLLSLTRF